VQYDRELVRGQGEHAIVPDFTDMLGVEEGYQAAAFAGRGAYFSPAASRSARREGQPA